jgi:hypothetical protein
MPKAILYSGPGVEIEQYTPDGGVVCMREVALQAGLDAQTLLVDQPLTPQMLATADLWLMPAAGGKENSFHGYISNPAIEEYLKLKKYNGQSYKDILLQAIHAGLGYVGCCAGAFWAGYAGLAGDVQIAASRTYKQEPILVGTTEYRVDLIDGPCFRLNPGCQATVRGIYEKPPISGFNVAVLTAVYGKGRVFLSGPHWEASRTWEDEAHCIDTEENIARNRSFLAARMQETLRQ